MVYLLNIWYSLYFFFTLNLTRSNYYLRSIRSQSVERQLFRLTSILLQSTDRRDTQFRGILVYQEREFWLLWQLQCAIDLYWKMNIYIFGHVTANAFTILLQKCSYNSLLCTITVYISTEVLFFVEIASAIFVRQEFQFACQCLIMLYFENYIYGYVTADILKLYRNVP